MPNTFDHTINYDPPIEDPAPQPEPDEDERPDDQDEGLDLGPVDTIEDRFEREAARADYLYDQARDDRLTDPGDSEPMVYGEGEWP